MIKILAKEYSRALEYLRGKLDCEVAEYDLFLSKNKESRAEFLRNSVKDKALIILGDLGECKALFAETFGLAMFYDAFAEKNVFEYCKLAKVAVPAQHVLDKICIAPETFNHFGSAYSYQCSCFGEYNKCHVYIVPDDERECDMVYENYIYNDLFKNQAGLTKYIFKVFGLNKREVELRLKKLNRIVSHKCETLNLDTKIVLSFPPKCSKSVIGDVLTHFNDLFAERIYSNSDKSLSQTVVELLNQIAKTIATAESITGGMIASSIVGVAGASSVFYEGAVTYSIPSKCKRLSISPHFIDEYGVVSKNVAREMALGLRKGGCDIAVSTTGYAGPAVDEGYPLGLCFISIASEKGVTDCKYIFSGDRNSIRAQATNAALFHICKTITSK